MADPAGRLAEAERSLRAEAEAWRGTRHDQNLTILLAEYDRRGEELAESLDVLTMVVTWTDAVRAAGRRFDPSRALIDDALDRAHSLIDYRDISEMTGEVPDV